MGEGKGESGAERPAAYREIAHLEEHHDGVRDVCFLADRHYLISVSEDATMKVWDSSRPRDKITCLATLREHSGPIFTAVEAEGHVRTGGMEGVIRCWNFPGKSGPFKKCLAGQWNNSEEQKL